MKTRVLKPQGDPMTDAAVGEGAAILQQGGLVAFPTETVYGLGADATSAQAIASVYRVKQRPAANPLIVHIRGLDQLDWVCCSVDDRRVLKLCRAFWPGPLTLVLPARDPVKSALCRGRETVAVRAPDHPLAQALIRRAGRPLAAPSANVSGRPSPTLAQHVWDDLAGRIPLILDGGPCRVGLESTVLDATRSPAEILRPGAVTAAMLEEVLGEPVAVHRGQDDRPRSPGVGFAHYRPRAPLYLIEPGLDDQQVLDGLNDLGLSDRGPLGYLGSRPGLRSLPYLEAAPRRRSLAQMARSLYSDIRRLDAAGVIAILADAPAAAGGLAASLLDRLERAASGWVGQARQSDSQRRDSGGLSSGRRSESGS